MQAEVGRRLGVHRGSVQNWERGVGVPGVRQMPAIIEFLGYDPEPEPEGLPKRIAYARRRLGFAQEDLALALKTSLVKLWQWESGRSHPDENKLLKLQHLLNEAVTING